MSLLAIGAHPDDVELGCGGGLAAAGARGDDVVIADLTRGELASAGTPEIRAREAAAAARVLGVARVNLGLPDGGLRREDDAQLRAVVELIRRVRPRLILAPADGDRHPDHCEAHHLVERAVYRAGLPSLAAAGEPHRPAMVLHYPGSRQLVDTPSVVVDISRWWEQKLAALDCYASQFVRGPGDPVTPINAPDFRPWLEARATIDGERIGVRHGEALAATRPLPLTDPLEALGPRRPESG